jgi:hypothetical protein
VAVLDSARVAAAGAEERERALRDARAVRRDGRGMECGIADVHGESRLVQYEEPVGETVWRTAGRDWILPELERRLAQIQDVVANAGFVAAYAFEDGEAYHRLLDAMPADPTYEGEVTRLIAAHRSWLPQSEPFPPFR